GPVHPRARANRRPAGVRKDAGEAGKIIRPGDRLELSGTEPEAVEAFQELAGGRLFLLLARGEDIVARCQPIPRDKTGFELRARAPRPQRRPVIADHKDFRRPDTRVKGQLRYAFEYIAPEFGHFADADMPKQSGVFFTPEIRFCIIAYDRHMRVERQPVDE